MSAITTHVLDVSLGHPAEGVPVVLRFRVGNTWRELGRGVTDANGRVRTLLPDGDPLAAGTYKIRFDTEAYCERTAALSREGSTVTESSITRSRRSLSRFMRFCSVAIWWPRIGHVVVHAV